MATIRDTRQAIEQLVMKALFGPFPGFLLSGRISFQEMRASYTEDPMGPRRAANAIDPNTSVKLTPVSPQTKLVSMQPGEKGAQLRIWVIGQDDSIDANVPATLIGIEIEVHRMLLFLDEEMLYTKDEMIDNQARLTDLQEWRAEMLDLIAIVEDPRIDGVPTRTNTRISYTVTAQIAVNLTLF